MMPCMQVHAALTKFRTDNIIDVNNIIILRSIEILPVFIKPRRVHKGYVSHFVCVYVCVSVCLLPH